MERIIEMLDLFYANKHLCSKIKDKQKVEELAERIRIKEKYELLARIPSYKVKLVTKL